MRTTGSLALLALLCCGCPGGRGLGASACDVDALEQLGRELEPSMDLDRAWSGIREACGDKLPGFAARSYDADTIASMRRGATASSLDPADEKLIQAACPAWKEAQATIAEVPADQRARAAYRGCEFGRFEVLDERELDDCSSPLLSSWALHAWMLEQGVRAESARPITRSLLALERRNELLWTLGEESVDPPLAKGDPLLPGLTVAISEGELVLDNRRLEKLAGGRVQAAARQGPLILSLHEALRGEVERSEEPLLLRVIADAETPFDTFHAVLHSAERAGLAEFSLIVGDEGGAYSQLPLAASAQWAPPPSLRPSSVDDRFAAFMNNPDPDADDEDTKPAGLSKPGVRTVEGPAAAIPRMNARLAQGAFGERPRLSVELGPDMCSFSTATTREDTRAQSCGGWPALNAQAEAFALAHPDSKLAVVSAASFTPLRQLALALEALHGRECDPNSGEGCAIASIVIVASNAHATGDGSPPSAASHEMPEPASDDGLIGRSYGIDKGAFPTSSSATKQRVRVRIGSARTKGNLDSSIVTRVVRKNIEQLKYCYESAAAKPPGHAGEMTLEFAIGSSGRPREVASSDTKLDRSLTECVTRRASRWRFPAPPGGSSEVLVWITLDFSPLD